MQATADYHKIGIDGRTLPTNKLQREMNKMQDNLKPSSNLKGHETASILVLQPLYFPPL